MEGKQIRFAQLLELHVVNTVSKKFANTTVNNDTLHAMRDAIHEQVVGVFKKSKQQPGEVALRWLSNQLFKNISLNTNDGKKLINELVIFNEYKLSELPYSDLQLLRNLFNETVMGSELEEEYRRRSAA
jgi:hypothetical protein